MKNLHTLSLLLAFGLLLGFNVAQAKDEAPGLQSTETWFFKLIDKDAMTIKFDQGKFSISDNDKTALRAIVEKAQTSKQFDRFVVAAWSDSEYPDKGVVLSKAKRTLATDRIKAVKDVLKNAGAQTVDTYSFAEHPTWLGKVFNSENAQIKREAGLMKTPGDQSVAELGREVRTHGGPQTAVVILVDKGSMSR
jgi:hypothetical protein